MRKHLPVVLVVGVNSVLAVIVTYAVLRAYDVFFKEDPNPAMVAWSSHIAMFWRVASGCTWWE